MPIQVTCNGCGTKASAPDSAAGRRGKCKKCGFIVEIPTPLTGTITDSATAVLSPVMVKAQQHPSEDSPDRLPSASKTCPFCAETIKFEAKKCRYCGEFLVDRQPDPPQEPLLPSVARHTAKEKCATADRHNKDEMLEFALDDYTKAITLDPDCARALSGRGWVYFKLREYDRAITDFNEAIRLDPQERYDPQERWSAYYGNGNCYFGRGHCYRELNEYDKAIADYSEALRHDPNNRFFNNGLFYAGRGAAYRRKGDFAHAIADLKLALRMCSLDKFAQEELNLAKRRVLA